MANPLYYAIFNMPVGWVGVLGSSDGWSRATLPRPSAPEAQELLGITPGREELSPRRFQDVMERLKAYYAGRRVTFPDRLDLNGATAFQREVWGAARLIPYGETRSYAWVAAQINRPKAARAVGQALGRNPLPVIIPCHRVMASDGGLGGFSGGLQAKRFLLRLEAASGT